MVNNAMLEVVMIEVGAEVADAEVVAHKAVGAQGGAKQW